MNFFILLFYFLILSNNLFSESFVNNWKIITSPTNHWLRRSFFTDTTYGWAVGSNGTIVFTSNGGENWISQNSQTSNYIADIFFLDRNIGWAVTTESPSGLNNILKTNNGGNNWTLYATLDSALEILSIIFKDSLNGYIGTQHGIRRTTNGGLTWYSGLTPGICGGMPIWGFRFLNNSYGFGFGGSPNFVGLIWKTQNSGMNWYGGCISPDVITDIAYIDSLRIIGVGFTLSPDPGIIFIRTSNGGNNWFHNYYGAPAEWGAGRTARRTINEFWVATAINAWLVSVDTTNSWFHVTGPDNRYINDVLFKTPTFGIAVGSAGAIYKYYPDLNGIKNNYKIPIKNNLYDNFPNPFNPITNIRFDINKTSKVQIIIYDATGKMISELINNLLSPGSYEADWDASSYASGIYYFRMVASQQNSFDQSYSETKRMVLIK